MQIKRGIAVEVESIAKQLIRGVGEVEIERVARECRLLKQKREITPTALLVACLSTLGGCGSSAPTPPCECGR